MAKMNAMGDPTYDPADPNALDPAKSRNMLLDGMGDDAGPSDQVISDPGWPTGLPSGAQTATGPTPATPAAPASAPAVDPNAPAPWLPGSSQPSYDPPGFHWDPATASELPIKTTSASTANPKDPGSMFDALMAQYGLTDGGAGSGFTDRAYWLAHPSEILNGRLAADLAGTGSDQPTGTPGTGPWQNSGHNAAAPAAAPNASPAMAQPMSMAPISASIGPNAQTSAYNQTIRDMMLQQLAGLSTPTTADSADVQPAISAYNTQSQRDQQAERDQLAERFYASGGSGTNSGAFDTAVTQGREAAAGQRANFTGSTILNASQQKRQQLQAMLQTATTAGLTDAAQQIQAQIAQIDANIRQQGVTNQNTQFGQSLSQQDQQYYDALAFQYSQLQAQENHDSLINGLKPNG